MRYFIYCRKSQEREDKQILSIDAQKRILTALAEKLGLHVVDVFVENQSAYKVGRPGFGDMMNRLENGEADAILTYHLTRLARNSFDGGRIIYFMDEAVVKEIRTPESIYLNNSDDKFMMQIHFAMAKKSSDDTSQFVTRDIESKLLNGEYPGVVPLGYLNIDRAGRISPAQYEPTKQQLLEGFERKLKREEIDPIDGPLMQKIFNEAAKGTHTLKSLETFAYDIGLRTRKGRKLNKSTIHDLLTNPYFHGAIRYKGEIYTQNIQHDPLVSKELFDRVQRVVCKRGKGGTRRHSFAYTGLMHCGECTCAITAEIQRGHVYYHCTHNKGPCDQRQWLREEELQNKLADTFAQLVIPESFLSFAFEKVRQLHKQEAKLQNTIRSKLERRYSDCKKRLDSLLDMKLSPKNAGGELLSDEEYLEQKKTIKNEMADIEGQLQTEHKNEETWIDDCERFVGFTQKLSEAFSSASLERKKEMLILVASNITVKDQEVATTYQEPFASLASFPLAGKSSLERDLCLTGAKNSEIFDRWLRTLEQLRTNEPSFA